MNDRPALLGSSPIFEERLQFAKPDLPALIDIADEVRTIVERGAVTKGKHLELLEEALATHLGVKHAVAVSSCTTGLMLTYQALNIKEAVLPGFTFMATASSLVWAGGRPVFVDVDSETMNLDVDLAERAITSRTDAIVATHNFGNPADVSELQAMAERHGLRLIFDAAHGMGSQFKGKPVGCQGDAQVFSLSATKLLIAGEGGVVATNDDELAKKIRKGREYGNNGDYDSDFAGINARLPELSALIARHSLNKLETAARRRNELKGIYNEHLSALPGLGFQRVRAGNRSSYTYFAITIDPAKFGLSRDGLAAALDAENIETRRYYDPPVHRHRAYRDYATANLPNSDFLAAHSLSLPIWSQMSTEVVSRICHAIERAQRYSQELKLALNPSTSMAHA